MHGGLVEQPERGPCFPAEKYVGSHGEILDECEFLVDDRDPRTFGGAGARKPHRLAANLEINPFKSVTTVTTQIVALLTGDQEFDSPKTLSAFALGLVLFVITLILNIYALSVVKKYREAYE